jgi:NADPH-dependent glutamate synthase beta subunit-like oxidoreductase/NAD(P)H-flavin reductase
MDFYIMKLNFSLHFQDLYTLNGLYALDKAFLHFLHQQNFLSKELVEARLTQPSAKEESTLILKIAPYVEEFIGQLFGVTQAIEALQRKSASYSPLIQAKRQFVQRYALKKHPTAEGIDGQALSKDLPLSDELTFAKAICQWLENEARHFEQLDKAARYVAWAVLTPQGQKKHESWVLFKVPQKTDPNHLISHLTQTMAGWELPYEHWRSRYGFNITDTPPTLPLALDQSNYCIWCHHQGKDSCSKGLKPKTDNPDRFQKNTFGTALTGCPLEEKISEMNELRSQGYTLGALATAMIDNPLVAGTGHRICNDCMKACIYQKQEPVNIPAIETQTLHSILHLPFGFEIYSLLSRWNPLNLRNPLPKPPTGKAILVAGMGPAGYTLCHYLLNEGHTVVGIDGLKIEPLLQPFTPIENINTLWEPLSERVNWGFGGVAEYGITVRWDKNYLKVIRLLLERRQQFALIGGIRLGGTLTIDQAFELGFHHVALCLGAGSPTLIPIKNGAAPGVRQASDFLMALQLSGAAKKDSLANLQVRLPIVVIGGGLTAIDTATEALAYYTVQVEKFAKRYHALVAIKGVAAVQQGWSAQDHEIAKEMLDHAQALQDCANSLEKQQLLRQWGGSKLVYRKNLTQAPSYTLNHEEVAKALEEGIAIIDNATPEEVLVDDFGYAKALVINQGTFTTLPAKTILVAAGTKPNTNIRYDIPDQISLTLAGGNHVFQAIDEMGVPVTPERISKPLSVHVLMEKRPHGKAVSFFGDLHPSFSGNVVKAMASAKRGYPIVSRSVEALSAIDSEAFLQKMKNLLQAHVHAINRLTPTIVEVVVHAPLAAQAFQPGQFYRLQNFEVLAPYVHETRLAMEGLALTGASVDVSQGLLSTIVLEMGGSSNLCAYLKPGDPVVLMGPTGTPTHIPSNETVLLVGGGLGNAVLFSIGQKMRAQGCKVLYFAGYKKREDRYKISDIEQAADHIVWCCDEGLLDVTRGGDLSYHGNMVQALQSYGSGGFGAAPIALNTIDRLIVIGSDRLMDAVAKARHSVLKEFLNPKHIGLGSINSPMQCMMKEICAQCLQRHVDPVTGEETLIYSCQNQDQLLDWVDFSHLEKRLNQNSVQEKITKHWINLCLKELM